METLIFRTNANKYRNKIKITKIDNEDILNLTNKIGKAKIPYIEKVLRKKVKLSYKEDTHPLKNNIREVALNILFEYIRYIIKELIDGNKVEIPHVGTLQLKTRKFVTHSRIKKSQYERAKQKGFFTMIEFDSKIPYKDYRYWKPYVAFGKSYQNVIYKLEDKLIKY